MKRAIGIGGIFFKSEDPQKLAAWYEEHLGIQFGGANYTAFPLGEKEKGAIVFSFFERETDYFEPSEKEFMINLRVENLPALLEVLRGEGVHVFDKIEEYEYGKFGWILDPEGNKIELWEPAE
jgi:predicted enzyme related to lactoylglutathione lyase